MKAPSRAAGTPCGCRRAVAIWGAQETRADGTAPAQDPTKQSLTRKHVLARLARTHDHVLFPVGQVQNGQVGQAAEQLLQRRGLRLGGALAGLARCNVFFLLLEQPAKLA